jgi:hypothetical protein
VPEGKACRSRNKGQRQAKGQREDEEHVTINRRLPYRFRIASICNPFNYIQYICAGVADSQKVTVER